MTFQELLEDFNQSLFDADYQRNKLIPNIDRMIIKIEDLI